MGYFQHKWDHISEAGILKTCKYCGGEFEMVSGNQKYCKDPACRDERWIEGMTERQYHKYTQGEHLNYLTTNEKMKSEFEETKEENEFDPFEQYETLPEPVQDILLSFNEDTDNMYLECERVGQELKAHGYESDYDLSGELTSLKKINLVKFTVTEILDSRKQGSEIELNKEFFGKLSDNGKEIFYTDKAGCEWCFWIGQTCELV